MNREWKARGPQPYKKNYRKLRNAKSVRKNLAQEKAHQLAIQQQKVYIQEAIYTYTYIQLHTHTLTCTSMYIYMLVTAIIERRIQEFEMEQGWVYKG